TSGERQMEARGPEGRARLAQELPQAMEGWPRHDIHDYTDQLTMPVCAIVGDRDTVTPAHDVKDFFESVPQPGAFTIVPGQHHSMTGDEFYRTVRQDIERMEQMAHTTQPTAKRGPSPTMGG